jgi:hypothetical protein
MKRLLSIAFALSAFVSVTSAQAEGTLPPDAQTVLSWGSVFSTLFLGVVSFLAPIIAYFIILLLNKILKYVGFQLDNARRDRLQEIVVNGINLAAIRIGSDIKGRMPAQLNSEFQKEVFSYVLSHGDEVMAELGFSKTDPKLVDAIQARIEKALNDPNVATPPLVTPKEILETQRPSRSGQPS